MQAASPQSTSFWPSSHQMPVQQGVAGHADVSGTGSGDGGAHLDPDKDKDKKASGKSLSHVPCKFFKQGSCTAGNACVFSHDLTVPGSSKPVCQWYVKGNCKFGHKCALAHILPGQPMSFDRKNKRAAQAAMREAQAQAAGVEGAKPSVGTVASPKMSKQATTSSPNASTSPTLTSSTLPPTAQPSGLSLSLQNSIDLGRPGTASPTTPVTTMSRPIATFVPPPPPTSSQSPLYSTGAASVPRPVSLSPPRRVPAPNSVTLFSTSPFSGSRALFMPPTSSSYSGSESGFPHQPPLGSNHRSPPVESEDVDSWSSGEEGESGVEREQAFLPSSLSDLLTPEELRKRVGGFGDGTVRRRKGREGGLWNREVDDQLWSSKSVPSELMLSRGRPPLPTTASLFHSGDTTSRPSMGAGGPNPPLGNPWGPPLASSPSTAAYTRSTVTLTSSSFDHRYPSHSQSHSHSHSHLTHSPLATAYHSSGPGSLPGGLAAGLSQLHLIPPSSSISGSVNGGSSTNGSTSVRTPEWGSPRPSNATGWASTHQSLLHWEVSGETTHANNNNNYYNNNNNGNNGNGNNNSNNNNNVGLNGYNTSSGTSGVGVAHSHQHPLAHAFETDEDDIQFELET